jgi:alkylhydroperoxidase/carboxymuconolactone decarboxylase family protein YurZ
MTRQHLRHLLAAALLAFTPMVAAHAQMNDNAPKVAPGTIIEPSKTFDAMLTSLEKEFTSAAEAMPADKYSFSPPSTPPAKFEGVRTFAQEITHVAQANYSYGSAIGKMKPDIDPKTLSSLTNKTQVLAALAASFAYVHKAIATLTPQNCFESVHGNITRAAVAGGVVAHAFDHYGQMVEYLRMNGIIPPASAK